jgi:hypothetical protein
MNREEWNKLCEENKWLHYKINLNGCDYLHHILQKESKKDTREDNSEECNYDDEYWAYINPFKPKQRMFVDGDGFNVSSIKSKWWTNKEKNKKSVWQKVESINELKVGDFIRFADGWDKNMYNKKGILIKIDDTDLYVQYFDEYGVKVNNWTFDTWINIEKAVLVEE